MPILLIARDENFRMRERLIQQLGNEQDHAVISAGVNALGRIGVDWDGASTRFLSNKINISRNLMRPCFGFRGGTRAYYSV